MRLARDRAFDDPSTARLQGEVLMFGALCVVGLLTPRVRALAFSPFRASVRMRRIIGA